MQVPFLDINRENKSFQKKFHDDLDRIINSDSLILGDHVEQFEQKFAKLCGSNTAIGVASGADALELALRALGLKKGDEVIVPANSFFASATAVCCAGATPVFCDVDTDSLVTLQNILEKVTSKTRAVMPVHLYGLCVNMDPIMKWADEAGCKVIEDACQAHGATYYGHPVGSLGHIAAFSFYPTKNLGALGDGGAVTTSSKDLGEKVKLWRNYGSIEKYIHSQVGRNSRLDTLQAAFLLTKISSFEETIHNRKRIASQYHAQLSDLPVVLPRARANRDHVFHLFVIQLENKSTRDSLRAHLQKKGISTLIHYPRPIHQQEPFFRKKGNHLPNVENLAETVVSLPLFPTISSDEVAYVAQNVRSFFKKT